MGGCIRYLFVGIMVVFLATGVKAKDSTRVLIGAEQLFAAEYFPLIRGKKIWLVTTHACLLADGRHVVDVVFKHKEVQLSPLFRPEHGSRGEEDSHVSDGKDQKTNLPVISLYGKVRKPTPEMLE